MKGEGQIVANVNHEHGTSFKLKHLMEWRTSEEKVKRNLRDNEKMYFCAFYKVWCAFAVK